MALRTAVKTKSVVGILVGLACSLGASAALAEVSLGKSDNWEAFTTGRVGAFATYATGDAYPNPGGDDGLQSTVITGGGLQTFTDTITAKNPPLTLAGTPSNPQGTISKWRVRSGFLPNILGLGVRSQLSENLKATAFLSIWGTIETGGQRKYFPVDADFREGWAKLEGSWGSVTIGRHLGLYSRGITEVATLYGHNYGVGSQAALNTVTGNSEFVTGPAGGMVGFGVLSATYSPGVYYTTPDLAGLSLSVGVYDAVVYQNWSSARLPRPEFELAYDLENDSLLAHVFVNGAYQKLYIDDEPSEITTDIMGVGGGLRLEFGPIHLGGGGHLGKGTGMWYAFAGGGPNVQTNFGPFVRVPDPTDPTMTAMVRAENAEEPRTFRGFSAFAQYAPGAIDVNLGFGQSSATELEVDKLDLLTSLIKTQTGFFGAFVYHVSENFHANLDVMHASFEWAKGQKQADTFINAGGSINW